MSFEPTEDQRRLSDEIVRFARAELNEGVEERDRAETFRRDLFEACGRMGLPGLPVPEEYGGQGADALTTAIALEAFGYGCKDGGLVFSVCAHLLACVVPVWRHGTEAAKRRWLPGLCDGSLVAVNGMTEAESGSDAYAMRTRAERDGDGWVLNGAKIFSSNGPVADVAVVYAVTEPDKPPASSLTAFVVEAGADGFSAGQSFHKLGLRTCPIGELVLDGVRVGDDAVIGGRGGGAVVFNESMEWERACLVGAHVGAMQRLLEECVAFARTRRSGGRPIAANQAVTHRLADMKVRLEAARLLTRSAASRLGAHRGVGLDASIAKLYASEALVESALDAVRIFGGYGFLADYGIERALRDSIGGVIYSGTNDIQRNIIARWLGL